MSIYSLFVSVCYELHTRSILLPQGRGPPIFCQEKAREREQREGEREAGKEGGEGRDGGREREREGGRQGEREVERSNYAHKREKQVYTGVNCPIKYCQNAC